MRILSIQFSRNWSWGLVVGALLETLKKKYGFKYSTVLKLDKFHEQANQARIILSQQVSILDRLDIFQKKKTICRIGSVRCLFDRPETELKRWRHNLSLCGAVIGTNEWLFNYAKKYNPNSYMIPNGLDLDKWKPKKFTVGFCGNVESLDPSFKGYIPLLTACKELGVEIKQALYGQKQIPHHEMAEKFYHQIDCIVHPTLSEGCSNTLMEACACGVPIITTRTAGFHGEKMTNEKNVLFCEPNIESIKTAILRLINEPELRFKISAGARKFAEKYHDINNIAEEYNKVIQSIIQTGEDNEDK